VAKRLRLLRSGLVLRQFHAHITRFKLYGRVLDRAKLEIVAKIGSNGVLRGIRREGRTVHLESGAGDGNRTHVRSLGSFYTAIVRRPLKLRFASLYTTAEMAVPARQVSSVS
jgi:hypothetical protein